MSRAARVKSIVMLWKRDSLQKNTSVIERPNELTGGTGGGGGGGRGPGGGEEAGQHGLREEVISRKLSNCEAQASAESLGLRERERSKATV